MLRKEPTTTLKVAADAGFETLDGVPAGAILFKMTKLFASISECLTGFAAFVSVFIIGLILVLEPLLPQYHFSVFWFSLGVISIIISLRNLIKK